MWFVIVVLLLVAIIAVQWFVVFEAIRKRRDAIEHAAYWWNRWRHAVPGGRP